MSTPDESAAVQPRDAAEQREEPVRAYVEGTSSQAKLCLKVGVVFLIAIVGYGLFCADNGDIEGLGWSIWLTLPAVVFILASAIVMWLKRD